MTDARKIRILCVDDHVVVRDGIGAILNLQPDMTLAASASSGREALEQYRKIRPDITLMDLRLTDMSGFDAIRAIRSEFPNAKFVVLSSYEGDADIREAMDAGAQGYVAKGMVREELFDVIRTVYAGKRRSPAALAQTLASMFLTINSARASSKCCNCLRRKAQQGDRRGVVHSRRYRQNARPESSFEAGRPAIAPEAVTIALRRGILHL